MPAPTNTVRQYVFTFVKEVKRLCKFITKHQGVFLYFLYLVITDPGEQAKIKAMIDAVVAGCAVLEAHYPNIAG